VKQVTSLLSALGEPSDTHAMVVTFNADTPAEQCRDQHESRNTKPNGWTAS
jgi:hypothetical protein